MGKLLIHQDVLLFSLILYLVKLYTSPFQYGKTVDFANVKMFNTCTVS